MDRVKYVAKVSGLAIAAGVGVAMASGVAAADTGDSDSDGGASSSASSTSESGSTAPISGDTEANTSAGPADPKSNDHSPSTKRSPKLPRVSSQASGAKSAASADAESESTAGPSRRPGSSSATDRSDTDQSDTSEDAQTRSNSQTDADDDAAPAAGSAAESAQAPAGLTDTTIETTEPEAVSAPPVVPSTTIIEATAPPTKPNSPANPAGMASVVQMLGAARRDTDSIAEVVPAAIPSPAATSPAATSPAAELLAAASSVARSLGANSNVAVNGVGPAGIVTVADSSLRLGEVTIVTFQFSEPVIGFTNADVTVSNGTLSAVSSADGGITWTATLTPNANVTDTSNLITLDLAGVVNSEGNAGVGVSNSNNFGIDTQRPTVTIVISDSSLRVGENTLVTFTFSEAVFGFTNADVTVPNGTLSAVTSGDGGITWTAVFTPVAGVTDTTNVITLDNTGFTDLAGNAGVGVTSSTNFGIDTQRPTATIVVSNPFVRAGENTLVTFTFSEAVTGFTNADVTVSNGMLSAVTSSDGGITWTATFTPTVGVTDTTNLISLNNAGVTDLSGNAGVGVTSSNNYSIDTQRPTATISVADTVLRDGQSTTVTFTFSKAVTGFNNSDITVANGTLSTVSTVDGGVTWTATFTSDTNVADATNVITVDLAGVTDAAGNAGVGTVDSNNYAVEDTQAPTAAITMANTSLKRGQSTTVTFTFSEKVTGFDIGDVTVANGRLSALSTADGGLTYTATFTPKSYVRDSTNMITLNGTGAGVSDAAGNALIGTAASANYSVQTVPGGFRGFVWHIYDFVVNQVIRPIGGFFHMLFFGPPPHLNHPLPVTPWSVEL